jgi:hypothetical protein
MPPREKEEQVHAYVSWFHRMSMSCVSTDLAIRWAQPRRMKPLYLSFTDHRSRTLTLCLIPGAMNCLVGKSRNILCRSELHMYFPALFETQHTLARRGNCLSGTCGGISRSTTNQHEYDPRFLVYGLPDQNLSSSQEIRISLNLQALVTSIIKKYMAHLEPG